MLRAIVPQIQQVQAACHTIHTAAYKSCSPTPIQSSGVASLVSGTLEFERWQQQPRAGCLLSIPPAASDVTEAAAGMFMSVKPGAEADLACSLLGAGQKAGGVHSPGLPRGS